MATLRFTILGCGSSGGVPRIGGHWGDCDPSNPKNRRRRCALLVERLQGEAVTRVLIDTGPDLYHQLLDAEVGTLDGVVYTHAHADHVHGLDDLRQIVMNMRKRLAVWADGKTEESLLTRFAYAFVAPKDSPYPPILDLHQIDGDFEVNGPAGPIRFEPITVDHGTIDALGFRIGNTAYIPDVVRLPEEAWSHLQGLDCWIIDALRRTPHPTHAHLALTLEWIARAKPALGVLTNMHLDLDYATLLAELPRGVTPAYDMMQLSFENQP